MGKGYILLFLAILVISTILTACGNKGHEGNANDDTANTNLSDKQVVKTDESYKQNGKDSPIDNEEVAVMENVKVKLTFNNEKVIVNMYDNPTSRDFLSQLPLTITLEDHAQTEKVSYLSKKLSAEKAPSGSDPSIGDFAYYAPWGNLAIYYQDFRYSAGLIKLGKIESGVEKLESIKGDFTVQIEEMN